MEGKKIQKISAWHSIHYHLQGDENASRLFILLHGYGQNSDDIMELQPALPKNALILAPDGPYPLGKRKIARPMTFAWYFYDARSDSFYIDYELPAAILKELVRSLNIPRRPTTIIGFSQGGYLAPFAGKMIEGTDHVIGISCRCRHEQLGAVSFRIDGIHGREDSLVDPVRAEESHQKMLEHGAKGHFHLLEGGHVLDDDTKDCLRDIVKTCSIN